MRDVSAKRSEQRASEREREREANRRDFAELAQVLDAFRAVFGPGTRITWASNGMREIGKRMPGTRVPAAESWPKSDRERT